MKELIIELCTENNSPEFINISKERYSPYLDKILNRYRLKIEKQEIIFTSQRIIFSITFEDDWQEGGIYEIKGPKTSLIYDEQGNPTEVYLKFLQQKSKEDSKEIIKEIGNKEYVVLENKLPQKNISEILSDMVKELYSGLNIKWKTKSIVVLTEDENVSLKLGTDITTAEETMISGQYFKVNNIKMYIDLLEHHNIELSDSKRVKIIKEQINKVAKSLDELPLSANYEVLAYLSEKPKLYPFKIDKGLQKLPEDIFMFFIEENPRIILLSKNNKVSNNMILLLDDNMPQDVVNRYTKAIQDSLMNFYSLYRQGLEEDFTKRTELLKSVVFLEDLGTMYDKVQRVKHITVKISDLLSIGEPISSFTSRAAELSKTDLTNSLVILHPRLHGIVGKNYALKSDEQQEVAQAIAEYQLPLKSRPQLPQTMAGSILSIADKIDTIVGLFSVGLVKANSDDPYKIKAKADGIIRIIERSHMDISLKRISNLSISLYESFHILHQQDKQRILKDVLFFFSKRIYSYLEGENFDTRLIDALVSNNSTNITLIKGKGEFLQKIIDTRELNQVRVAYTRLKNMLDENYDGEIQLEFLTEDQEKKFYENLVYYKRNYHDKIDRGDFEGAFQDLFSLSYEIEKFFKLIYVHSSDEALRINRLNMLYNAYELYYDFCDFDKLKNN